MIIKVPSVSDSLIWGEEKMKKRKNQKCLLEHSEDVKTSECPIALLICILDWKFFSIVRVHHITVGVDRVYNECWTNAAPSLPRLVSRVMQNEPQNMITYEMITKNSYEHKFSSPNRTEPFLRYFHIKKKRKKWRGRYEDSLKEMVPVTTTRRRQ